MATKVKTSAPYQVLARKYRSRDFDELVGQAPIARTLRNAVVSGRTAHAYLFCGTRGVGKTSMARILARALNATPDLAQAGEIAEAILRGSDLDVIEIDGASNRGVQDARDLIAAAGLSPARCPYKIYIIDEVHALTKDAFNALLKTMEEPPAHVKFILCTTEPSKVPTTIQSRCQRFDFRPLSTAEISAQLRRVLEKEHLKADEEVVAQVARLGRGSMRDALSLLDRLLAAGEPVLTPRLLQEMLGLPDHAVVESLVGAIAAGDSQAALRAAAALLDKGVSVEQALDMLVEHLRDLLVIALCGPASDLLELSAEAVARASTQAAKFDAPGLVHMIALCDAASRNARYSEVARALFDAAVVRLCESEHLADIATLLGERAPATQGGKKKEQVSPASKPAAADAIVVETKGAAPDEEGLRLWASVRSLAAGSPRDQALIEGLAYRGYDGRALRVAIETGDEGLARWLASQAGEVAALVRRATSRRLDVTIEPPRAEPAKSQMTRKIEEARDLPLVRQAMEIFDADVVEVDEEGTK